VVTRGGLDATENRTRPIAIPTLCIATVQTKSLAFESPTVLLIPYVEYRMQYVMTSLSGDATSFPQCAECVLLH
jgi:hypothetical protein